MRDRAPLALVVPRKEVSGEPRSVPEEEAGPAPADAPSPDPITHVVFTLAQLEAELWRWNGKL